MPVKIDEVEFDENPPEIPSKLESLIPDFMSYATGKKNVWTIWAKHDEIDEYIEISEFTAKIREEYEVESVYMRENGRVEWFVRV